MTKRKYVIYRDVFIASIVPMSIENNYLRKTLYQTTLLSSLSDEGRLFEMIVASKKNEMNLSLNPQISI